LKFKHLIDDITIDFCSFLKIYKYERYKKKINSMVDLLKFTF